jgi:hypothetical protein
MIFHPEVLKKSTKDILDILSKQQFIRNFYLAGGTALALQYGHRISIDLDFFSQKNFSTDKLISEISKLGKFELLNREENTVDGLLNGVKVSFIGYPYCLLKDKIDYQGFIKLADASDIAVMKIMAVSGRNTKKDFIDLFWHMQKAGINLSDVLDLVDKKYADIKYDRYHIFKSLSYFVDADKEPMPKMLAQLRWKNIKIFFVKEVKRLN